MPTADAPACGAAGAPTSYIGPDDPVGSPVTYKNMAKKASKQQQPRKRAAKGKSQRRRADARKASRGRMRAGPGGGATSLSRQLTQSRTVSATYRFKAANARGLTMHVCLPIMRIDAVAGINDMELVFNCRDPNWGPLSAIAEAFQEWRPGPGTFHMVPTMAFDKQVTLAAAWVDDPTRSQPDGPLALAQFQGGTIGGAYLALDVMKGPSRVSDWLFTRQDTAQSRLDAAGKLFVQTRSSTAMEAIGFVYWEGEIDFRDLIAPQPVAGRAHYKPDDDQNGGTTEPWNVSTIFTNINRTLTNVATLTAYMASGMRVVHTGVGGFNASFKVVNAALDDAPSPPGRSRPRLTSIANPRGPRTLVDGVPWNDERHAPLLKHLCVRHGKYWRAATLADCNGGEVVSYIAINSDEVNYTLTAYDAAGDPIGSAMYTDTIAVVSVPFTLIFPPEYWGWSPGSKPGITHIRHTVTTGVSRSIERLDSYINLIYAGYVDDPQELPAAAAGAPSRALGWHSDAEQAEGKQAGDTDAYAMV